MFRPVVTAARCSGVREPIHAMKAIWFSGGVTGFPSCELTGSNCGAFTTLGFLVAIVLLLSALYKAQNKIEN
jgi:hypothetical protein